MTRFSRFTAFLGLVSFTLLFTVFAAYGVEPEYLYSTPNIQIRKVDSNLIEVKMRVEIDHNTHTKFEAGDLVYRIVRNDLGLMTSFKVLKDRDLRRQKPADGLTGEDYFGESEGEGYIEDSWNIVFRLEHRYILGKRLATLIERLENSSGGYCVPLLSSAKTLVSAPERGGRLPPIDPTGM